MITLSGLMINFIDKSEYKNPEGLTTPTKAKVQILVENIRANGSKVKDLHTISIPDSKIAQYKGQDNKQIDVKVGIISKSHSFYGI